MFKRHQRWFELTGLFFFSLLLFTWGLLAQEVIGFDSRFYLFAQEMWQHGPSWFPTTYDQPYPDYPASSILLIDLFAHLFGGLNKLVAVLPTAIMASITIVFTYLIGELRQLRLGLYAIFFMLLTVAFFKAARSITLDMYTTMVTAACFYLIYSADVQQKFKRVWLIYPLLLIGFAFRGPIGLVVPAGVIASYYLLNRNVKQFFITGFLAFILLAISTLLLLTIAKHVGGETFMQAVLRMEVLGRMQASKLPFYFYFVESLGSYAIAYPLALLTIIGVIYYALIKRMHMAHIHLLVMLMGWMLIVLVGMSIPGDKKVRYILPMMPSIALLAAYSFVALPQEKFFRYVQKFLLTLFLFFPALCLLASEIVFINERKYGLRAGIHYLPLMTLFSLLQLGSFWCYYRFFNRVFMREVAVLFFATLSFAVGEIKVLEPIELHIDKARSFVIAIEKERKHAHAQLVFYKENQDSMPIKYLINMPEREKPLFIQQTSDLEKFKAAAFFVTSAENFMQLPPALISKFRIVGNERLGHVPVVVFTRK
jgi:4-amino-4-deoxy-L-arabinose transferase-like glycosyltransferase